MQRVNVSSMIEKLLLYLALINIIFQLKMHKVRVSYISHLKQLGSLELLLAHRLFHMFIYIFKFIARGREFILVLIFKIKKFVCITEFLYSLIYAPEIHYYFLFLVSFLLDTLNVKKGRKYRGRCWKFWRLLLKKEDLET